MRHRRHRSTRRHHRRHSVARSHLSKRRSIMPAVLATGSIISLTSLSNHQSIRNSRAIRFGEIWSLSHCTGTSRSTTTIVEDRQNQAKLESELYGSAVGMVPVASKALKGLGSSAYSAYKGVRRYLNRPKSSENYDENDA
jgi:hypothetical protein